MATITIEYDGRNAVATSLIDTIKKSGVFKIENKKSPYEKAFVEKINRSRASVGTAIKTADLWK